MCCEIAANNKTSSSLCPVVSKLLITMRIVSIAFIFFTIGSTVRSHRYAPCELAKALHYEQLIPTQKVYQWVCLASIQSSLSSNLRTENNVKKSYSHGIFQVCVHKSITSVLTIRYY